ncbi:hypothetical protein D3C81_566490 [compost metagenome]
MNSLPLIHPKTAGPNTIPRTNFPRTAGCPIRTDTSPAILVQKMINTRYRINSNIIFSLDCNCSNISIDYTQYNRPKTAKSIRVLRPLTARIKRIFTHLHPPGIHLPINFVNQANRSSGAIQKPRSISLILRAAGSNSWVLFHGVES